MSQIRNDFNNSVKESEGTESGVFTGSSTTTTYHTKPGVSLQDQLVIKEYYNQVIGNFNGIVAARIAEFLRKGMRVDVLLDAITTTGYAQRPSFYYLFAILRRYEESGIKTMEDVMEDNRQREERRRKAYQERYGEWYRIAEDDFPF